MNITQVAATNPVIYVRKKYQPRHFLSTPLGLSENTNPLSRSFLIPIAKPSSGLECVSQSAITAPTIKVYPRNLAQCVPVLKSRKPRHVCLAGGKGMMDNSEVIYFHLSYTMHAFYLYQLQCTKWWETLRIRELCAPGSLRKHVKIAS